MSLYGEEDPASLPWYFYPKCMTSITGKHQTYSSWETD